MTIQLFRVILPVSDIERAAAFYGALLEMPGRRVSPGRHYFDLSGVILACFDPRADGDSWEAQPNPDHIYFAVEDLEASFDRARQLECQQVEPEIRVRPWGERSFYATDPFGNRFCFVDETTRFTGSD